MSTEYDSAKIRRLAAQIGKSADAVAAVRRTPLKSVMNEMPENFKGSAANALETSVSELMQDVGTLSAHLGSIRDALYALANRVDEADRRAAALIKTK